MRYAVILIVFLALSPAMGFPGSQDDQSNESMIQSSLGRLPLYFIENQGQMDEEVAYYVKGADRTLYFTSKGITFALADREDDEKQRWIVKLDFTDADLNVNPKGDDRQPAVFNYFKGTPEKWNTGIPTYNKLVYEELWPGIDLVYSGTFNRLKYEFIVKPGADPGAIRLVYQGADRVALNDTGGLEVTTPVGGFEDGAPSAYQDGEGKRKGIPVHYVLEEEAEKDAHAFGFDVGDYDPEKPLVIDPVLLIYCGYIGGWSMDYGEGGIAVDGEGNAYVAGNTKTMELSFPVVVGPDLTYNREWDVFVAKVNAAGTGLEYCGYIGGIDNDFAESIAVDGSGSAYVVGYTASTESSFPVTLGPDLTYNGSFRDAFVAKVNAAGTGLEYCGYIGGDDVDYCYGIAVDGSGKACVIGETHSDEASFPVEKGPDITFNGYCDAFIARVAVTGMDLEFCGYIGGDSADYSYGIALDSSGCAHVIGKTGSDESTFPVLVGPDLSFNKSGAWEAFVAKVNAAGTQLLYCGYIGGEGAEYGHDIAVDDDENACVTGITGSDESTFPVLAGPDLTYNGQWDVFVAKVNPTGSDFLYCGYIGGEDSEEAFGITVDTAGCVYVTGNTGSDESTFPVVSGPDLSFNGNQDAFVTKLGASGIDIEYCGYIGGKRTDYAKGIALDAMGRAYVAGSTYSDEKTFPVTRGPDLTYNGGYHDVFVAKLTQALAADTDKLSAQGGTASFALFGGADNANRNYLLLGSISGTSPGTSLPGNLATLPLNWDLFTNVIIGMLNSPVFTNFQGKLDGQGDGTAKLNLPTVPGTAGLIMHFAFALNNPWDFASNPVVIEIVP